VIGQKILSCVLRCKENFGGEHIAKVLIGDDDEKVLRYQHDKLSTFGLLKEHPKKQIRNWIDQLAGQGYLEAVGEYRVFKVTPAGRRLLKGEATPVLSLAVATPEKKASRKAADDFEGVDRGLFEELRVLRRQLALQAVVPAFVIFSDATLCDLARRRPVTLPEMLKVHGVGQRKCDEYGQTIVHLIARYCSEHKIAANVDLPAPSRRAAARSSAPETSKAPNEAAALFDQGLSIGEISLRIGRAPSTVQGYFLDYLKERKITDASAWASQAEIKAIEAAAHQVEDGKLKPIYESLNGEIGYDVIRMVLTCMRNREEG
jgi:ATP-dependent DNA helicase RecQ